MKKIVALFCLAFLVAGVGALMAQDATKESDKAMKDAYAQGEKTVKEKASEVQDALNKKMSESGMTSGDKKEGEKGEMKMPEMPKPTKEHEWLQQFAGEWESETEMWMEPGKPSTKSKSTESIRPVGKFWVICEVKTDMNGEPFTGYQTLGYDPEKKEYVGTWVDSMGSRLWTYTGKMDDDEKTLKLDTEGPCPMMGGKMVKMQEILELKDKDHKIYTSKMQGEDGKWATNFVATSTRKQ